MLKLIEAQNSTNFVNEIIAGIFQSNVVESDLQEELSALSDEFATSFFCMTVEGLSFWTYVGTRKSWEICGHTILTKEILGILNS
ncbi:hypothetical protein EVB61_067 [Rhizobium phage RHph_TM21B]|nr:hypothetical protein EVB61_067 [Rhizobium phage RHph_TM21B]